MEEQRSTGVWVAFIIALVLALVFGILWFLRGGDIDRLNAELNTARTATQRVENNLRTARSDIDAATRRAADFENQLREETRRAADSFASTERRMRTELDIANQRLATAAADLEQIRAAGANGVAAEAQEQAARAEAELESLRTSSNEQLAALNSQLEQARGRIAELEQQAADAPAALNSQLEQARNRIAELEQQAADAPAELNSQLEQARGRIAELEQQAADAPAELNSQLEQAHNRIAELEQQAADAPAALNSQLEQARNRIAELEQQAADAPAAPSVATPQSDAPAAPETSQPDAVAWSQQPDAAMSAALNAAETEILVVRERAARELAAAKSEWKKHTDELSGKVAQATTALDALRKEYARQTADWQKRLADKDSEIASRLTTLQREAASSREAMAKAQTAEKETAAKLELLQAAFVKQSERLKQASKRFDAESRKLAARASSLEKALAEYMPGGSKFGLIPTVRSVGRIVDRIDDGMIMLIDTGSKDGIKPGMKFDIYRPVGGTNRFVGMVKVVRVLDKGAMVVSSYLEVNSLVCPKTGRVVLEPEARYSPFATDTDGKALPLVCSNKIDMPLEAPAVGDLLDNPFFFPNRRLQFLLEDNPAEPCLLESIRILGGAANTGQWTSAPDFIVGTTDNPDNASPGLRVKPEHIYRYVELAQ